ncbi:MAG: hypothetical protein ACKVX7_17590 [Planctomycetota bacterium]
MTESARGGNQTYFWDFFGPLARPKAEHFVAHLGEFLAKHELADCVAGLYSAGDGHCAATCVAPPAAQDAIERALRPNRFGAAPAARPAPAN